MGGDINLVQRRLRSIPPPPPGWLRHSCAENVGESDVHRKDNHRNERHCDPERCVTRGAEAPSSVVQLHGGGRSEVLCLGGREICTCCGSV